MKKYCPTPVNRLGRVKSAEFPIQLSVTFWGPLCLVGILVPRWKVSLHNAVCEQVVVLTVLWIHQHTHSHTVAGPMGDINPPITSSVCGVSVGEEGRVGSWRLVGFGGVSPPLSGCTLGPVGTPVGSLPPQGCREPQRATTEGESSRVNVTNTRSLILLPCTSATGRFQKLDPLFSTKIPPPPHHAPPLFFSLTVILQQKKGRAFVVAHSVTQTQDLRLPVVKWKLSLGLSQRSLCSCRLGERGGNSYFST